MRRVLRRNALAVIAALASSLPVLADGKAFLHLEFDNRRLDIPAEAIASVQVIKDFNNQDALEVAVTAEWTAPLAAFTADPQGRTVRIFICGGLVAEPALQSQIGAGRFYLTGDRAVIHKSANYLKAKSCAAVPNS